MGLGEYPRSKVDNLSKGMQQKMQFAATFIFEPDLVILDEVFSGLDPLNIELMRDLILEEKAEGHHHPLLARTCWPRPSASATRSA